MVEELPSLRDVRCFARVARRLGFSAAADELGVSQSAVSQAVARLERQLGVRLLERTSRAVALSAAGRALLPRVDALLAEATDFTGHARALATGQAAISLAYPGVLGGFVARVVRRLALQAPAVQIDLRPAGRTDALAALDDAQATAAIIAAPLPVGLAGVRLFRIGLDHLAVPADDPLATARRIRLDRLRRHRVLLPRHRPPGGAWARLAARVPRPSQIRVVADELDDFGPALDQVAAGRGLLPVPDLLVAATRRGDLRFVPLESADAWLTYLLAWPTARTGAGLMTLTNAVQSTLRPR